MTTSGLARVNSPKVPSMEWRTTAFQCDAGTCPSSSWIDSVCTRAECRICWEQLRGTPASRCSASESRWILENWHRWSPSRLPLWQPHEAFWTFESLARHLKHRTEAATTKTSLWRQRTPHTEWTWIWSFSSALYSQNFFLIFASFAFFFLFLKLPSTVTHRCGKKFRALSLQHRWQIVMHRVSFWKTITR